jgi:hypothetical protein
VMSWFRPAQAVPTSVVGIKRDDFIHLLLSQPRRRRTLNM